MPVPSSAMATPPGSRPGGSVAASCAGAAAVGCQRETDRMGKHAQHPGYFAGASYAVAASVSRSRGNEVGDGSDLVEGEDGRSNRSRHDRRRWR